MQHCLTNQRPSYSSGIHIYPTTTISSCLIELLWGCLHWTSRKRKERCLLTPNQCLHLFLKTLFPCIQFPIIGVGSSLGMQQRRLSLWSQMLSSIRMMSCSFTLKRCTKTHVLHPHPSTTRNTHPTICAWWKSCANKNLQIQLLVDVIPYDWWLL